MAPPGGGPPPPGAVETGGAGSMAGPQGPGMLPPSAGPTPQSVPAQGNDALFMAVMSKVVGVMHFARGLASPDNPLLKHVDSSFRTLAKHFIPDSETMKGGSMQSPGQIGRGGAAPPPGPGGPGPGAMAGPPSPPRGPIPMPPTAGAPA